uniref:Uncharacterized protein n=1 Tax=Myotis myotis TaxID=51298 RepID=A0A7J7SS61_MYOMY|nr:hypothetical protein mMyoMyo1_009319 [Myotis myotis]
MGRSGLASPWPRYSRFSHLWRCPWGHSRQARKGCWEALLQGPRPRRLAAPVLAHPTFLYLGLAFTLAFSQPPFGAAGAIIGRSKDRATGAGKEGREAVPCPRSQGQPGTNAGVTLLIWVLSSGPWPRAGLSARGCDKQELLWGKAGQVGARVRAPRAVRAPTFQLKAV